MTRLFDRMRSPAAATAAESPATGTLASLRGRRHLLLVSYRRDGRPVPSPMWFGIDRTGTVYCRSAADAAKVQRIRNNSSVLVAPCGRRGRPLGPPVAATAVVVDPRDEAAAEEAIRSNYRLGRRLYKRLLADAVPAAYIAIDASAD